MYAYIYIYIYLYKIPAQRKHILVANGRHRFLYIICGICIVLLNLIESQKSQIYLFYFMSKS